MSSSLLATVLALTSALMHASWNAAVKSGADRLTAVGVVDATALVICAAAAPFVLPPSGAAWTFIGLSLVLNTVFRLCLVRAYQLGDFGQMYPIIRGISPLAVAALSVLVLHQSLTALAWTGVVVISAGISSLVLAGGRAGFRPLPIAYALVAGLCVAGYTASDAAGLHTGAGLLSYTVYLFLVESVPMPLITAAVRRRRVLDYLRTDWRTGLLGGLAALLSYVLMLAALSLGAVARVEALRETSIILAAGIGALFFKEAMGRHRIVCAVIVTGGIVLVSM
ncbi:drug/metabolite transporter (DMT)-like permease [Kitasatospora sp. MAP12-15]|uniref:EamA family transporter n=1 Tax=unclassified Kitasatospora TaxID=2633591 RepID=UPI0024756E78|nr:EamA family transporter [Kitasatospora sp. MAP12-44]MDH6113426.1 drug/metabolite transporter (DMT)-like permease [Kitasatospora sp. MAP12-44]